jgi:tetratricopeptide (TPR) repeat protein
MSDILRGGGCGFILGEMRGESVDLPVEIPGSAPLTTRLHSLLQQPAAAQEEAQTARGWVDLAYEAAYGERYAAAAEAAERGLKAPGSQDAENRLMLLRLLSGVHEMRGASAIAAPYLEERVALLRQLGRTRQAEVEAQLGTMLLREPDRVEAEILRRMAEELDDGTGPSVHRADVLSSLAVRSLHDDGPDAALPLITEACEILEALGRPQALAGARMFLAHAQLLSDDSDAALATANQVLSAPANRAVRGAMAMLRATVHHQADRPTEAVADAMTSVELYSACGVRKGAASAAALLAGITASLSEADTSVLAWRVAVQQAELGEFSESRLLSLALGQQLLDMEQYAEAEKVLEALSLRLAGGDSDFSTRGRALMGLGHAVTQQKRPLEAMSHWEEAATQFISAAEVDEAARAHLAAGALAASLDRVDSARRHYERGLNLADQGEDTDPLMLLQALHSLGHLLCRHEEESGLDYLDRAMDIVNEHGTDWQRADITDTRARSLTALGRGSEAVAAALEAADMFAGSGDEEAAADAEIFAATVLLQMNQPQEAETLFRMAAESREISDPLLATSLEGRAEALTALGKHDAAAGLTADLETLRAQLASEEDLPHSE